MSTMHHTRLSDSHYLHSVSHIVHDTDNLGVATPDGCWDMVILTRADGNVTIFRTGMLTRAIPLERKAGDELLVISFRANAFMPNMSARQLVDRALDFRVFNKNTFLIENTAMELPNFDNVETFIDTLVQMGIVGNDSEVASALQDSGPTTTKRTMQRHFIATTGVTRSYLQQIARAQRAALLLQRGMSPSWAAAEAGYFDQAQMTKFLKHILGQTPGQIRRQGINTTKDLSL